MLDGGEEVALLGLAVDLLKEGGLLVGEGLVEALGAGGGLGADGPVEVDEGAGTALGICWAFSTVRSRRGLIWASQAETSRSWRVRRRTTAMGRGVGGKW